MNFDNKDPNESKQLLKNKNVKHSRHRQDEHQLLSNNFLFLLKIINIATLTYIIFSTMFYILVHYYGKRLIKSKSVRIEYDTLLYQNLFVNFYFTLSTILAFITINRRSVYYFCFYFITLLLYSTLFFLSYFSNFYSDYLVNKKFIWFSFFIFISNLTILFGIIYKFLAVINNNKQLLENNETSASNIIHEVSLRTDMMKISFNHFVIKMKLHKVIPSLLFKRDSFYYTSLSKNVNKNENERNRSDEKSALNVEFGNRNFDSDSTFYRTREFSSIEK